MNDFDDKNFDDLSDAYTTITMTDETGGDIEFVIISSVESEGINYLLVMEALEFEMDTEMEAVILKEVLNEDDSAVFAVVEDDDEFVKAAALFKNSNDDYELEL